MKNAVYGVLILMAVCACGGGGGGSKKQADPASVSAPIISAINISPTNLHFTGGNVGVDATVIDNRGVATVSVEVSGPGGNQSVAMSAAADDYSATVTLPANENIYEEDAVYTFIIKATDSDGNKMNSTSFTVTVRAMKRPPDPPLIP